MVFGVESGVIMSRLNELKKENRCIEYIEYELRKERSEGVHTYHYCDCGRGNCRRSMCIQCWEGCKEEIEK